MLARWPPSVVTELASFQWPLTTEAEVKRLLVGTRHCRPRDVVVGEFTAAIREANERHHGVLTLSIDLRPSLTPGAHACLDARLVLPLVSRWRRIYGFPPCTHQTLSDTTARDAKQLDGRAFWGIVFFIWLWCQCCAMIMLEQPDTIIPDYYITPSQRLRTSDLGCEDDKRINLFERNRARLPLLSPYGTRGASGHGRLSDFASAEERDRWRSSWLRFGPLVEAVVQAGFDDGDQTPQPVFQVEVERFAVAWHSAGLPVPHDYANENGQPTSHDEREYQATRGQGDGRRVRGITPHSLSGGRQTPAVQPELLAARLVCLASLTVNSCVLFMVAMQTVPLVFAALNGYEVVGAEFHIPTHRKLALGIATRWVETAINAPSATFLAGEYKGGTRLLASPLDINPPQSQIVRTAAERRRRVAAGVTFAWCTIAALAGTIAGDPAARAVAACSALRAPVDRLADSAAFGHPRLTSFSFGAFATRPLVDRLIGMDVASSPAQLALEADWGSARWLAERLRDRGHDEDLLWLDRIRPPELQDVPADFFQRLPTFSDARLDGLPFTAPYTPPLLAKLLPRPTQPRPIGLHCPRSAFDLMPPWTERRMRTWFGSMLSDLVCIRDYGVDCERQRPTTLVVAQSELYPWARGLVWDFRAAPAACGTPLNYSLPLRPTLNASFFSQELADYPNQRILGMIQTGVVYQADVELHAVFVPHLTSLPKGFKAVHKELHRLREKGWYDFFAQPAFFPGYFNSQGSTARKLEKDRDRRTTEGGAPRRETWDRDGLRVLSINNASKAYHLPRHYVQDHRPEMMHWLESRGLPPSPEQLQALAAGRGSKWGKQYMPNLGHVMRDLTVLRRAARRLGFAVYILGNDVKDYFNHLENAVSELPLMNIAWIGADELKADARQRAYSDGDGNHLVFISERRMGFGIHPNSGIAQELSEAIDYIFRKRMDAKADPWLEQQASSSHAFQAWLNDRRVLERRVGGHQRRLYAVHTYCDDSITLVVGPLAMLALDIRGEIEREAGLIMAIPEKRMLGTWGLWLGIYIFTGLGFIVVPRSKIVRALTALGAAVNGLLPFDEYQSLMGLLEHVRHASCWPRRIMHGLYRPHGPEGESRHGPSTLVKPNFFMASQLQHWTSLLMSSAGAVVSDAVSRSHLPSPNRRLTFVGSSDAATDSDPPGMGGYMHGLYWYLPLTAQHVRWLHISVLEMLATGFSTILFRTAHSLPSQAELVLGADATATVTSLTTDSENSEMLIIAHHALLRSAAYQAGAEHTSVGHLRGDSNDAADAVSRNLRDRFFALCKRLKVRPKELNVTEECRDILTHVLGWAIRRGAPVRPNPYVSTPLRIPADYDRYISGPLPKAALKRARDSSPGDGARSVRPRRNPTTCDPAQPGGTAIRFMPKRLWAALAAESQPSASPNASSPSAVQPRRSRFSLAAQSATVVHANAQSTIAAQLQQACQPSVRRSRFAQAAAPTAHASEAPSAQGEHRPPRVERADADRLSKRQQSGQVKMPTVTIGQQVFPAPFRSRAGTSSLRRRAMTRLSQQRADAMAPANATAQQRAELSDAIAATQQLAEFGAADGTLDKDDHAWEYWERFCQVYGWSPLLDAKHARSCPDEVSQRLAMFQAWVYPQLSGRGERADAKPRSAFNGYVLAIRRIFMREHIPMPAVKHVEKSLAGLQRNFKAIYGVETLMPGRKQPLTPNMWRRIEDLTEGQHLPGRAPWSPANRHRDQCILRIGRVLWRTGHRLGEIVAHPSGELNFLTRSCVSIRKASGAVVAAPTGADWRDLRAGDSVLLAPCASKTDPFGEVHCMFPSVLPFNGDAHSAAASVRDIELETPCQPSQRDYTPLFSDENGRPFTYSVLHKELRTLLTALFGAAIAGAMSWHSIRIGLACALHAAGCPDAVIQLICRWECPGSLHVYRQLGVEQNTYWTDKAGAAKFDALRVNNLPALDKHHSDAVTNVLATAAPAAQRTNVRQQPPQERVASYPIPGGTVQASSDDSNGLVGKSVRIFNNFWRGHEDDFRRTTCTVSARCSREFLHPDGSRSLTYLVEFNGLHYPIKHAALLACTTASMRAQLPTQRG